MAADAGCQPIFLSVQTVRKLSGEAVDPEECSAILECRSFRTAYSRFLEWHTSSDHVCPFYSWLQIRIPTSGDSACYDAMPPSSARNGGDFIETKANQNVRTVMLTLLFGLQALCMGLPHRPEESTCMSATDGRSAMPMSVLMSAHCSQWGHWRMAICATNAFWPIVP